MNPLVSWHSGHTESGRYYFRLEALGAEATHIVHAALFLARGEDDRFVRRLGERITNICNGKQYEAPLVLRDEVGRAACEGLRLMEIDCGNGFNEIVREDCSEEGHADYSHAQIVTHRQELTAA